MHLCLSELLFLLHGLTLFYFHTIPSSWARDGWVQMGAHHVVSFIFLYSLVVRLFGCGFSNVRIERCLQISSCALNSQLAYSMSTSTVHCWWDVQARAHVHLDICQVKWLVLGVCSRQCTYSTEPCSSVHQLAGWTVWPEDFPIDLRYGWQRLLIDAASASLALGCCCCWHCLLSFRLQWMTSFGKESDDDCGGFHSFSAYYDFLWFTM